VAQEKPGRPDDRARAIGQADGGRPVTVSRAHLAWRDLSLGSFLAAAPRSWPGRVTDRLEHARSRAVLTHVERDEAVSGKCGFRYERQLTRSQR
jgi:hypothetical protein